ncbi:hypothetical protein DFH06DRAFT_1130911 [Mycena polygramma]|nr:hypothetical protein DFH06DRAFT_1130911 [Mycena polygramma]
MNLMASGDFRPAHYPAPWVETTCTSQTVGHPHLHCAIRKVRPGDGMFDAIKSGAEEQEMKTPDCGNEIFGARDHHGQFRMDWIPMVRKWHTVHAQLWLFKKFAGTGESRNDQKPVMAPLEAMIMLTYSFEN